MALLSGVSSPFCSHAHIFYLFVDWIFLWIGILSSYLEDWSHAHEHWCVISPSSTSSSTRVQLISTYLEDWYHRNWCATFFLSSSVLHTFFLSSLYNGDPRLNQYSVLHTFESEFSVLHTFFERSFENIKFGLLIIIGFKKYQVQV